MFRDRTSFEDHFAHWLFRKAPASKGEDIELLYREGR